MSPTLAGGFFTTEPIGKPCNEYKASIILVATVVMMIEKASSEYAGRIQH